MTNYSNYFHDNTPIVYDTDQEIGFYEGPFNGFNNYSAHAVEIWGLMFPTSEHAYHWAKFPGRPDVQKKIFSARSADQSKQLPKQFTNEVREDWPEVKRSVMKEIITAKLAQHVDIQKQLRESGDQYILENSPRDYYWGVGHDRSGENVLGQLWMELREEMKVIE